MRASFFLKQAPRGRRQLQRARLYVLLLVLLLALALVGCDSPAQSQDGASAGTPATSQEGQTPTAPPVSQGTSTPEATTFPSSSSVLQGPTNFVFKLPFAFTTAQGVTTDNSGATVPLKAETVKSELTQEMRHMLFVVDGNDNLKVYNQGSQPFSAQLTFNPDGSARVSYTQTASSEAGTITMMFSGLLSKKQIAVQYEQQYNPSIMINAQSSDIVAEFTTPVQWVAPDEIPTPPTNGVRQTTSQGGIALSWSAGQHAAAYDVYRLISDQNQQFQLLATVKETGYIDNSAATIQNIHATKGITYAIFSVGPTGVENPGGIIISV